MIQNCRDVSGVWYERTVKNYEVRVGSSKDKWKYTVCRNDERERENEYNPQGENG